MVVPNNRKEVRTFGRTLQDIRLGTTCLLSDPPIRLWPWLCKLVAAIAGAAILNSNTASGIVQGNLQLGKLEYGWVMGRLFGVSGAPLAIYCD